MIECGGEGENKKERDKVRKRVEIEIGVGEGAHCENGWRSKKSALGWTTSLKVLVVLPPSLIFFFYMHFIFKILSPFKLIKFLY